MKDDLSRDGTDAQASNLLGNNEAKENRRTNKRLKSDMRRTAIDGMAIGAHSPSVIVRIIVRLRNSTLFDSVYPSRSWNGLIRKDVHFSH